MQENGKRLLSLLMVVAMLLSMMPVSVGAQELEEQPAIETVQPEAEPEATLPQVTEPVETEPQATEPVETEPQATEPVETVPQATEPVETDPQVTEPVETEPLVTEPVETKPQEVILPPTKNQSEDGYPVLTLGQPLEVELKYDGSYTWVEFTPEADGAYAFTFGAELSVAVMDAQYEYLQNVYQYNGYMLFQNMRGGSTYYVGMCSVIGDYGTTQVTVDNSPLESITFEPITFVEGTCGHIAGQNRDEMYYYYPTGLYTSYKATFADGTEATSDGDAGRIYYQGQEYGVSYKTDQDADNPWVAGNTYTVIAEVMGHEVEIPVTIVEAAVESISIAPISIIANSCGGLTQEWNSETESYSPEYFCYQPSDILQYAQYTVTYSDGTTRTEAGANVPYEDGWWSMAGRIDQSYENQWTVGNAYTMDVFILGQHVQVSVSIVDTYIEEITFAPITIMEGTIGGGVSAWNEETQTYDLRYFQYALQNLLWESEYTITMVDGTVITGNEDSFVYNGQVFYLDLDTDQSYDNQWVAGGTYALQVEVMGVKAEVPVTIEDVPVESFTVAPLTVVENTRGEMISAGPGSEAYFKYNANYILEKAQYTVTFADGTTVSGTGTALDYDGMTHYFYTYEDQSYENQWVLGGEYTFDVFLCGKHIKVPVTVLENPVMKVEVAPVTVAEEHDGSWIEDQDDRYYHYDWAGKLTYTITFVDGTVLSGNLNEPVSYGGDKYEITEWSARQGAKNPWLVDNTYTAQVRIAGVYYDVEVTVAEYQAPVLTLDTLLDMTAEQDANAEALFTPEVSGSYVFTSFGYYDTYGILYEVTPTGDQHIAENDDGGEGTNFLLSVTLEAGHTYKLLARQINFEYAQFQVQVSKSPLESLVFQGITIMPGTNGNINMGAVDPETGINDQPYFYYFASDLLNQTSFTATFTDGTVITGNGSDGGFTYNGVWYDFNTYSGEQWQNPWQPGGTYYFQVEAMGAVGRVPVTIQENPVQSITVEPVTIIEGTCGRMESVWNPDTDNYDLQYYYYYSHDLLSRAKINVTLTNGYTHSGYGNEDVYYHGSYYGFNCMIMQSYEMQWTAGHAYTMYAYLMGQYVEIPVTIVETPVASVRAEPVVVYEGMGGSWNEYWNGEQHGQYFAYHWWNNVDYYVTFKDGTSATVFDGNNVYYNGMSYSISPSDSQGSEDQWTVGNTYTATITVMGVSTQVSVTVAPSPVESVVFEPFTLEEYTGGYWSWSEYGEYYHYYWTEMLRYTVTFRDGTVKQGTYYDDVEYEGLSFGVSSHNDDQSAGEHWFAGNTYAVQVMFEGKWYETYATIATTTEQNGYTYLVQGDKAIINGCTLQTEILQIPATIDGYPVVGVTYLGDALAYAEEVRIPDSVTMLSGQVFDPYAGGTIAMKKLVLGSGVAPFDIWLLQAALNLEQIVVSEKNPNLCSVDGVLYNKEVTQMLFYPLAKQDLHKIPDSVTDIGKVIEYGFAFRESKPNIQFGANIDNYKMVDGVIYDMDMARVIMATASATGSYVMPNTVQDIDAYAFSGTNLTSITVSPKVTELGYAAFHQAINLEEINIPSSVTYIHYLAFTGCEGLEKVGITDLGAWCNIDFGTNPLLYAHDLYLNGQKVVDLVLPETVTDTVYFPEVIFSMAFAGGSFKSVTIPSRIKYIGYDAFVDCENLTRVNTPSLADWCSIGYDNPQANPLYYAKNLYVNGQKVTNVVIPKTVTGDVYVTNAVYSVNDFAFYNANIKSLTVPSYVYTIGMLAFSGASLESITLEEGVSQIWHGAFQGTNIKSLTLPDSLSYMESSVFADCKALTQVEIGSGLVTIPAETFYNTGLKSVTIPANIEYVGGSSFAGSKLTKVEFLGDNVQIGWSAFAGCPLGDLKLGDNITWINEEAFSGINATQISHPSSVTELSYRVYALNPNLVSVTIPDTVTYISGAAFDGDSNLSHVLYTGTEEQWNALEVESDELNQATIHFEATGNEVTTEEDCTSIRLFCTICNKWETVYKKNTSHTFNSSGVCTICGHAGLWDYEVKNGKAVITAYLGTDKDVKVPETIDGKTVIGFTADTFAYNRKITSVTLPDSVTEIPEGAFAYCSALRKVTLGKKVTRIGTEAFLFASSLATINLPQGLTAIGDAAFYHCYDLKTTLPKSLCTIGAMAFYACESLETVEIPAGVTQIAYEAFASCDDLREVILPDTVTAIGYHAFSGCWDLEKVNLPKKLTTIENYAFGYTSLKEVTVPASVEWIGMDAFYTNFLKTVIFLGDKPQMENAFNRSGVRIFYPSINRTWIDLPEDENSWYACETPEITSKLTNLTVAAGESVTLAVEAYGQRLRYQWYYAAPNSTKFNPIGGNSMELTMTVDQTTSRGRVYCVVTDIVGQTAKTETVILRNPARATGIHLNQLPYTLEYDLRQELRTRGLEVVLKYDDGTEDPIIDYTITGYDPTRGGQQTVTVSFNGYTAAFQVKVNEEKLNFTNAEQKVELSAPEGAVDSDVELVVETVYAETVLPDIEEVPEVLQENESVIFDISLEKEGQTVQPEETVQVSIPVPEHMESKRCKIFYIADDGTATDMNAQYKDGRMVFDTDHFSYYAMVEVTGVAVSGKITGGDVAGAVVKLISGTEVLESAFVSTSGNYLFENVVSSDYVIEVSKEGMPTKRQQINVLDQDMTLDILLAVIGDLTGDGEVDSLDGLLLLQYLNGWDVEINVEFAMDVNGDDKVDSLDGLLVMRYLNNWGITLG